MHPSSQSHVREWNLPQAHSGGFTELAKSQYKHKRVGSDYRSQTVLNQITEVRRCGQEEAIFFLLLILQQISLPLDMEDLFYHPN